MQRGLRTFPLACICRPGQAGALASAIPERSVSRTRSSIEARLVRSIRRRLSRLSRSGFYLCLTAPLVPALREGAYVRLVHLTCYQTETENALCCLTVCIDLVLRHG